MAKSKNSFADRFPRIFRNISVNKILSKAPLDKKVGIRHLKLKQGTRWSYHIAEIQNVVSPHVHMRGGEVYYVISGNGIMHTGKVRLRNGGYFADWDDGQRLEVKAGDAFLIPPRHAHSLENAGPLPLVIGFRCPDSHLTDTGRSLISNLPVYAKNRLKAQIA